MTDTRTDSVTELEELLGAEIPCGGIDNDSCHRGCGNAAVLAWTDPHNCLGVRRPPGAFKCIDCWMVLYQHLAESLVRNGGLNCVFCGTCVSSVLAFTDHRPF